MSNNRDSANAGGSIFSSLLTVLFIGLKLTGHIDWSWWWVLSPLWLPLAFLLGLFAVVALGVWIFERFTK